MGRSILHSLRRPIHPDMHEKAFEKTLTDS